MRKMNHVSDALAARWGTTPASDEGTAKARTRIMGIAQVPRHIAGLAARRTALALIAFVSLALVGCASTSDQLHTAAANDDAGRVAGTLDAGADPSDALDDAAGAGDAEIVDLLPAASSATSLTGDYSGGLRVARDSSGVVTGRFGSYSVGLMGTAERPQFSCEFSFYGFPVGEAEEYVIASWDPPVWRPDAPVEEGINTTGTLSVVENSIFLRFVEDPSGGCWNVEPFTQGTRFRLNEKRAWSQVRVIARDARLLTSPGGAVQTEPLLRRGELALVLEERDGWHFAEIERVGPIPEDESEQPVSRFRGWLRESVLFPISPPNALHHSKWVQPTGPEG